jgi:hypothetical protein
MRNYSEFLDLLDGDDVSPIESARRASLFLVAMSFIAHDLLLAEYKTALADDAHDNEKAELLITAPDSLKNAPMREAHVIRSPSRKEKYEIYIKYKSQQDYLKRLFSLFQEAHQFFRQKGNQQ